MKRYNDGNTGNNLMVYFEKGTIHTDLPLDKEYCHDAIACRLGHIGFRHWIRRRVRMCYWRQWRKPRTKVANLLKRGVRIQAAVGCGITSKGPWRSSKTPGINQAISNDYLVKEGLFSLRNGWGKVHYPNG